MGSQSTHLQSPSQLMILHPGCREHLPLKMIGFTAWQKQQDELGFSVGFQNAAAAALNYGGLGHRLHLLRAPFVHSYGRRPPLPAHHVGGSSRFAATYMFGSALQLFSRGGVVGLMNLAPYIGSIPGVLLGGYLSDRYYCMDFRSATEASMKQRCVYGWPFPWLLLRRRVLLLCGMGLAHWPIVAVAVGYRLFGFGLVVAGDVALSYAMDCYHGVSSSL
ncbi:hypothetical protein C2857_007745 [Epichloe festucae Fl1]|uniref:Uncharacterized protein n=1 Tax=Epichloe festucae (strain Fl1) TaxID=877507 RepID=A0A7S9PT74_EPIFF|nr:hypothetical protein C2857_007745 [Epichloe festucae Fl1]